MTNTKSLSNDTKIVIPRRPKGMVNAQSRIVRGVLPIPVPPPLNKPDLDDELPTIPCPDPPPKEFQKRNCFSLVILNIFLVLVIVFGVIYWFYYQSTIALCETVDVSINTEYVPMEIVNNPVIIESDRVGSGNFQEKPSVKVQKSVLSNKKAIDRWGI